jgi:hypothetical protein
MGINLVENMGARIRENEKKYLNFRLDIGFTKLIRYSSVAIRVNKANMNGILVEGRMI